jgi:hypothetical protein
MALTPDQAGRLIRETSRRLMLHDRYIKNLIRQKRSVDTLCCANRHIWLPKSRTTRLVVCCNVQKQRHCCMKKRSSPLRCIGRGRTEVPAVSVYDASTDASVTSASINVRTETTRAGLYTEVTYDALECGRQP